MTTFPGKKVHLPIKQVLLEDLRKKYGMNKVFPNSKMPGPLEEIKLAKGAVHPDFLEGRMEIDLLQKRLRN